VKKKKTPETADVILCKQNKKSQEGAQAIKKDFISQK
jgi:hypothetical protein